MLKQCLNDAILKKTDSTFLGPNIIFVLAIEWNTNQNSVQFVTQIYGQIPN